MIIDTDVLIWYLKGNPKAAEIIDGCDDFSISAVTCMELVQGMRNRRELSVLRRFLSQRSVKVIQISEEISSRAMFLVENHFLSHSLRPGDALVAATGLTVESPVMTGNVKDFRFIKGLVVREFKP